MIRRYDFIVRVDESSGGYYVSFDDIAHLIPHKGNDLPEDASRLLVCVDPERGLLDTLILKHFGEWAFAGSGYEVDLSSVTHWMRVPEVET